tara:strand:- start:957 stop:1427 length:471 start_codon:yes stop_codon:yes gene_type:complete
MNINKILSFLIILIFSFLSTISVSYSEDVNQSENSEETVNLDEEELPAIDPFGSSSAGMSASPDATNNSNQEEGILKGLKLVGVIIGENKKIAVLISKEGYATNFEENDIINNNVELQEIYKDYLLIKDTFKDEAGLTKEKFYEVYMNDVVKSVDG